MTEPNTIQEASELLRQAANILRRIGPNIPNVNQAPVSIVNTSTSSITTTPSSTSSNVNQRRSNLTLSEVRDLFRPYDRTTSTNTRLRQSGARATPERSWGQKFFCLAFPYTVKAPTGPERLELAKENLGQEIVDLRASLSSFDVEQLVRQKFTKLTSEIQFELLMGSGSGPTPTLLRISASEEIPPASVIGIAVRRAAVVFVRPKIAIVLTQTESDRMELEIIDSQQPVFNNDILESAEHDQPPPLGHPVVAVNEFGNGTGSETIVNDDACDMITMDDLRRRIYEENPGVQPLHIRKDGNYALQVLCTYKHPRFNIYMEPDVTFVGEFGADAGALMREYFWTAISSLSNGKYLNNLAIFEGDEDHKIPCCDAVLLRDGIFHFLGKFMVHCAIHTGIAFMGLSKCVVQYIVAAEPGMESGIELSVDDVADEEVRSALKIVAEWKSDEVPEKDAELIKTVLEKSDIYIEVSEHTKRMIYDHILYQNVIGRRKPQLDAIRKAFTETILFEFLSNKHYLHGAVFPSWADAAVPNDVFLKKLYHKNSTLATEATYKTFVETLEYYLEQGHHTSALAKMLDWLANTS